MSWIDSLNYISFGFSFLVSLIAFVGSDSLWKKSFFNKCLAGAIFSGVAGLIFEFTDLFSVKRGTTITVMLVPAIYLGYFQLFRLLFKKWKGTEPYETSASSVIGGMPLDINDTYAGNRKYPKDRKIMAADFVFSFAQVLIPIFTIFFLLFYVFDIRKVK